jgi:xanthine dehydrogenase accessory factor
LNRSHSLAPEEALDVLDRVSEFLERGESICLATVVDSGNASVRLGQKILVRRNGTAEGSLGSRSLDLEAAEAAQESLRARSRRLVELSGGVRLFLEVLEGETRVLICGAGHIALPLARFAREVGFSVTVVDDRSDFADPSRFPGCQVLAEDFARALRGMPLGPGNYAVVITRGHEHDVECLTQILRRETAYVGLIGSRRRVRLVLELLEREGIPAERLREVFTPIGLPVGAESPEEIALAITAELVCVRREGPERARALRAAWEVQL